MKLVKTVSRTPDQWWGNNIVQIWKDDDGRYWETISNDAYAPNHPDYRRIRREVRKVEKTTTEWEEV